MVKVSQNFRGFFNSVQNPCVSINSVLSHWLQDAGLEKPSLGGWAPPLPIARAFGWGAGILRGSNRTLWLSSCNFPPIFAPPLPPSFQVFFFARHGYRRRRSAEPQCLRYDSCPSTDKAEREHIIRPRPPSEDSD